MNNLNESIQQDIKQNIYAYFTTEEDVRQSVWTNIMLHFQLYMDNPKIITFRLIRDKEHEHPILIFINTQSNHRLLIPLIPDRIVKLKLSDFIITGVKTEILEILLFDNIIYKVYNDRKLNRKPMVYEK